MLYGVTNFLKRRYSIIPMSSVTLSISDRSSFSRRASSIWYECKIFQKLTYLTRLYWKNIFLLICCWFSAFTFDTSNPILHGEYSIQITSTLALWVLGRFFSSLLSFHLQHITLALWVLGRFFSSLLSFHLQHYNYISKSYLLFL